MYGVILSYLFNFGINNNEASLMVTTCIITVNIRKYQTIYKAKN